MTIMLPAMRRPIHLPQTKLTRTPVRLIRQGEPARAKRTSPAPIILHVPAATPFGQNAYAGYVRVLTAEGGVHITYKNVDTRWRHTIRRVLVWTACTILGGWLLLYHEPLLSDGFNFLCLIALMIVTWLIVRRPVEMVCTVEIRPDCMVLDGTDVFRVEFMEGEWPIFQPDPDDEDTLVLGGVYGSRFVEYITAHRLDEHDRTPELLATHLQDAIEQIWSRAEFGF